MNRQSAWAGTFVLVVGIVLLGLAALAGPGWTVEPQVGDRAPDFTLPATTGGTITLGQFRGKKIVLLEFYGADFSPV